jgi:hypothetical protein
MKIAKANAKGKKDRDRSLPLSLIFLVDSDLTTLFTFILHDTDGQIKIGSEEEIKCCWLLSASSH